MELRAILAPFLPASGLTALQLEQVRAYLDLLLKWNEKTNLTSVRQPEEILRRHFGESFFLATALAEVNSPNAGPRASAVQFIDVGSGAGLPIIPCLLVRNDLAAILIESSARKSAFLREAVRLLQPAGRARIINGRFEDQPSPEATYLTCRALERFGELLPTLVEWAPPRTTFLTARIDRAR